MPIEPFWTLTLIMRWSNLGLYREISIYSKWEGLLDNLEYKTFKSLKYTMYLGIKL